MPVKSEHDLSSEMNASARFLQLKAPVRGPALNRIVQKMGAEPFSFDSLVATAYSPDDMPTFIAQPTRIKAAGNKPKLIDEYVGHVNTRSSQCSVAHMRSPEGWFEPGQRPSFDEMTIVLKGHLRVEHQDGIIDVRTGQAVIAHRGEWVRYSTPSEEGAEYIAVCIPAFLPSTAHRDSE